MLTVKGRRILVVEDNILNRVVYSMTLALKGAYLDFDRYGTEALDRLKWTIQPWDLIILDLMLHKGISGFDVFQQIRSNHEYDQVPIIAVSASEPSVAIPRAREMGFSGFIAKPIQEEIFEQQIARIISGEQIWHENNVMVK